MLSPFDQALIAYGAQGQLELAKTAARVHDCLLLAKRACVEIFGTDDPQLVLAIYDRINRSGDIREMGSPL